MAAILVFAVIPSARAVPQLTLTQMGYLLDGQDVPVEGVVSPARPAVEEPCGRGPAGDAAVGRHVRGRAGAGGRYAIVLGDTSQPGHTDNPLTPAPTESNR